MTLNDLDGPSGAYDAGDCAGLLSGHKIGIFACLGIGSALGFLGGMLLGKRKGEARGLALGLELGRTEAVAAMAAPRSWRQLWRREVAA